jgi:hypothetical protein
VGDDLADPQKSVTAFKVGDATIAGAAGPSIGRDGTIYIATAPEPPLNRARCLRSSRRR